MIERSKNAVEVFFSVPGSAVMPFYGRAPVGLTDANGIVPFDDLRNGTADQGDWLIQDSALILDGDYAALETMSMMLHPEDFSVPFTDPLEASMATWVCNAPDPGAKPLSAFQTYAGFIAYPVDGYGSFEMVFAHAEDIRLNWREFKDGAFVGSSSLVLKPSQTLSVPAAMTRFEKIAMWGGGLLAIFGAAGLALAIKGLARNRTLRAREA